MQCMYWRFYDLSAWYKLLVDEHNVTHAPDRSCPDVDRVATLNAPLHPTLKRQSLFQAINRNC